MARWIGSGCNTAGPDGLIDRNPAGAARRLTPEQEAELAAPIEAGPDFARSPAPNAPAIVVLDQAGWHTTDKLRLPETLSLLPLPPKSPGLNPVENVRQFLRQNKLSNRIFNNYEAIITAASSLNLPRGLRSTSGGLCLLGL